MSRCLFLMVGWISYCYYFFLGQKMQTTQMDQLKQWFIETKRTFPWRDSPTPYAVWVSEVMLQQTRASVVVSYFTRWMRSFPTVKALAEAPMEEVLKAWEGLGYYSRARNLKQAAIDLLEKRKGILPDSLSDLLQMKGVGSYTAGAIASFAFHQKAAAVDGNVARVVSRYFALEEVVSKKELESKTLLLLPDKEPWVVMEALIELGATLCQKVPACHQCPLQANCLANKLKKTDVIPKSKKAAKIEHLSKTVAVIVHEGFVLVEKKQEGKLLGGLIEFPSFPYLLEQEAKNQVESILGLQVDWLEDLPKESYSFTRYQVELFPSLFLAKKRIELEGMMWKDKDGLSSLTFSAGHKRVLQDFFRFADKVLSV